MFNKNKFLLISIVFLAISGITWQLGTYYSNPGEMDEGTSFAIIGSIGTVFFLFTTLVLYLVSLFNRKNRHDSL